jgi:ADP-heptose:LPS heptosyltransferase
MKSCKLALVKPDHLGDFVLALPAIRALQARGFQPALFVSSRVAPLARHYFPDLELVTLDLPHLYRGSEMLDWPSAHRALGALRGFDIVIFLRRDAFLTPQNFLVWTEYPLFIEDQADVHQAQGERAVISQIAGDYDIDRKFYDGLHVRFPEKARNIVFSIGSGFPSKKWSPLYWAELGQLLLSSGAEVKILCGLPERSEAALIARAAGLSDQRDVFVGTNDFRSLENWLEDADLVVAVDGGGAHLCSTRTAVLTIFGSSPFRKFAPIGRTNRIMTRELSCSPCAGFNIRVINACVSRECLYGLRPKDVVSAIGLPSLLPGKTWEMGGNSGVKVKFGVSAVVA